MKKEFITYEQALELKELGFDEPCFGFYTYKGEIRRYTSFDGELNDFQTLKNSSITVGDDWCTAPTFSQSFRWIREKYDLYVGADYWRFDSSIAYKIWNKSTYQTMTEYPDTYEEAENACIDKLIELVKKYSKNI